MTNNKARRQRKLAAHKAAIERRLENAVAINAHHDEVERRRSHVGSIARGHFRSVGESPLGHAQHRHRLVSARCSTQTRTGLSKSKT